MKIAAMIVRILMGLLFIFGAVAFFLFPQPELPDGNLKTFTAGLAASIYFMPFLKITELICGIALVTGRFVPLALVILSPIIINIFLVHSFLEPSLIAMGIATGLVAANSFLGYYYWNSFKQLFVAKAEI